MVWLLLQYTHLDSLSVNAPEPARSTRLSCEKTPDAASNGGADDDDEDDDEEEEASER